MDHLETIHAEGVEHFGAAWVAATHASRAAAREMGLCPIRYKEALAAITLAVLKTNKEQMNVESDRTEPAA